MLSFNGHFLVRTAFSHESEERGRSPTLGSFPELIRHAKRVKAVAQACTVCACAAAGKRARALLDSVRPSSQRPDLRWSMSSSTSSFLGHSACGTLGPRPTSDLLHDTQTRSEDFLPWSSKRLWRMASEVTVSCRRCQDSPFGFLSHRELFGTSANDNSGVPVSQAS